MHQQQNERRLTLFQTQVVLRELGDSNYKVSATRGSQKMSFFDCKERYNIFHYLGQKR